MLERLQKVLAHAGLGSRRACETLITAGRVAVDRRVVVDLGTKVDPETQEIAFDGVALQREKPFYAIFNKPRGVICTSSPRPGRARAIDFFKSVGRRLYTVGRLDFDSEGLLIVTNDGELTDWLTHPRYGVPKTYRAIVRGFLSPRASEQLQRGVWLSEGKTAPAKLRIVKRTRKSTSVEITLHEGKNREVRRIFAKVGHPVSSLTRISIGRLSLGGLPPGQYKVVGRDQLLRWVGLRTTERGTPVVRERPEGGAAREPGDAKARSESRPGGGEEE